MHNVNRVSNRVAVPIVFFSLLIAGVFGVLLYLGTLKMIQETQPLLQASAGEASGVHIWNLILFYFPRFWYTVFPVLLVFSLILGLLAWLFVRSSVRRLKPTSEKKAATADKGPEKEKGDIAERRLFLHLFAMMQREGRLMDFLAEDLDQYEDSQIGSAVRAIHANCRQVVQEYLDPGPIMAQSEGERVIVASDFDPGAIKLTGNVVGEPPFSGIIRHKGWQVGKVKLPKLSGRQNAEIIAPAEVEI
ncbi:MAG: DUF2760 domain-containing protein [Desulfobacterales bacterium]|jgi:hypothetical protein